MLSWFHSFILVLYRTDKYNTEKEFHRWKCIERNLHVKFTWKELEKISTYKNAIKNIFKQHAVNRFWKYFIKRFTNTLYIISILKLHYSQYGICPFHNIEHFNATCFLYLNGSKFTRWYLQSWGRFWRWYKVFSFRIFMFYCFIYRKFCINSMLTSLLC